MGNMEQMEQNYLERREIFFALFTVLRVCGIF